MKIRKRKGISASRKDHLLGRRSLRLGKTIRTLDGQCYRCESEWDTVKPHDTPYTTSRGCFPLCEKCWEKLTPAERLPYYQKLIKDWRKGGYTPTKSDKVKMAAAVMAGK